MEWSAAMTTTQTIITVLVICAILAFRIYRQTREQLWKIGTMWAVPAVFLLVTIVIVSLDTMQNHLAPLAALFGVAAGVGLGLYQGNHTTLRLDKPNKAVYIRVAPIGSLIFILIIVARIALRFAAISSETPQALASGAVPTVSPAAALIGSALLALAAGTVAGLRLYVQRQYDAS
jgi:hypothetical protein